MNKRQLKKQCKRTKYKQGKIKAQGNCGGDEITIKELKDGRLKLEVYSSCCLVIRAIVPVEFMTGLIDEVMIQNNCDVGKIIDQFGWSKEFKQKIKNELIIL